MEKNLITRLNEIGLEVGYPYEVLKNGQYRKQSNKINDDEVAMVVFGSIQNDSVLSELSPIDDDDRKVWSQLFPNRPSVKNAVLTQQELSQLILFGRRSTVLNYIGKKNIGERAAKLLISRNDDELIYKIRNLNYRLPTIIALASVQYMSDERFSNFIAEGVKRGFCQFSPQVEEMLIKHASLAKFKAYVKHLGLRDFSQFILIKSEKISHIKAFAAAGRTLNKEIEENLSLKQEYKAMFEAYQNSLKM